MLVQEEVEGRGSAETDGFRNRENYVENDERVVSDV
jgi:hypothetical protein